MYLVYDVLNLFEMACGGIGKHHFKNRYEKHMYVVNVTIKIKRAILLGASPHGVDLPSCKVLTLALFPQCRVILRVLIPYPNLHLPAGI